MKATRSHKAKVNIATTLLNQLISTLCGIVIPRVMIGAFGSVVYGATTSITQFLSYISLLEGGIGRVARGALYKPLAERDERGISRVYHAIKRFFGVVGLAFVAYTLVMAFVYHDIARIRVFDRPFTFALVWAISLSTLAKYLGGIANLTLLNADQKQYVTNLIITGTTVVNTLLIVLLVMADSSVLLVKLGSSLIFIARPLLYSFYVKKHYRLPPVPKEEATLPHKWNGLGQHMAYFLHTNTDVVILTLCADLRFVSVYAVYHLIITSIRNITSSFSGGMEAALGDMIAKGEQTALKKAYDRYKLLLSTVTTVLFGVAAVMILPFVKLYTAGIHDAEYIQPVFALLLLLAEAVNCLMLPCSTLPISANRLKETQWGAYGEAIVNITLSLALVWWDPLVGVAVGTLAAALFKGVFYMQYAVRHILHIPLRRLMRPQLIRLLLLLGIAVGGMWGSAYVPMDNFLVWCLWAVPVFLLIAAITLAANYLLEPETFRQLFRQLTHKLLYTSGDSTEATDGETSDRQ